MEYLVGAEDAHRTVRRELRAEVLERQRSGEIAARDQHTGGIAEEPLGGKAVAKLRPQRCGVAGRIEDSVDDGPLEESCGLEHRERTALLRDPRVDAGLPESRGDVPPSLGSGDHERAFVALHPVANE